MRRSFLLGLLSLVFFVSCRSYEPGDPLDKTIPISKLTDDFILFRQILESTHPSLNLYLAKDRMNYLFDSLSASINSYTTSRDFYNKLFFFTNAIGCSHTTITLPDRIVDTLFTRSLFFPLPVILINNRLIVNSDLLLPRGTEIEYINNRPVEGVLNSLMFYNPVEGVSRKTQKELACKDFGLEYFLQFGGVDAFKILFKDTLGRIRDTVLSAATLNDLRSREADAYYYDATDVPYFLHFNEEKKYAFMRLATFDFPSTNGRDAFEDFVKNSFELLSKKPTCKNLIIDLRENGGGYLYSCFLLFSYLAKESFEEYKSVSAIISKILFTDNLDGSFYSEDITSIDSGLIKNFEKISASRYEYTDSLIEKWSPEKNRFRGNVYIITDEEVMSSASYFALLVKNSGRGLIVGAETSGGSYSGNGFSNLKYRLPNSEIALTFPYARIVYSYNTERNGRGVIPDYSVPDTYLSFKENTDAQVRFIVDSLILKLK